ncbi:MAG: DUF3857 domain-containing protein [Flavobacterium sp.]|uniref:DUF3857 domain-containing protein n=1 Tax=Flavobacterium sp. TaxID=239 RepID=UPI00326533D2
MVRFNQFFLLLILISVDCFSQKLELDKVSKAELLEKSNPGDTTAPATFLFKKARTFFKYTKEGFVSYTEFQIKLKIYKKEGLEWGNFRMPYYIGYEKLNDESIKIRSAFTYNLENDKIVKSKVTNDAKFIEDVNEYWKVKSLTFPNVKVGSVIELKYELKTENLSTLPDFQFQYEIPVNKIEYVTEIPELYIYKGIRKGYIDVVKEEKMVYVTQNYDDENNRNIQLGFNQINSTYKANNIPAIKEESYVNNIDNYLGKIVHELQIVRMPEKEPKQIATTWEDVAKSIYDDKDFKTAITQFDYFLVNIKSLLNGVSSPEEKTKKILDFVKNRMNWNGRFGYYPRKKMEQIYTEKVGNVAEINLMLVAMLRISGIDANPVLISTRENGIAPFPSSTLFNYVIASANIDGKTILLDATDKYSDLNVLPIRDLNWFGRLIKKDGTSTEINLMPTSNSKDVLNIMGKINSNGDVSGKIREQYLDYNAFVFREKYNKIAKESYVENLEKKYLGLEITDYNVQNGSDLNLPIIENYDFTTDNSVEIIGDKMYVSPFLFFATSENPFKQETRQYPIDFTYPKQEKYSISLTIPDGYTVETLPQPKAIAMPDGLGSFKYLISNTGNQIQLLYTLDINQAIIGAEYYSVLKDFFKEIVNKQTEKIVLKKA